MPRRNRVDPFGEMHAVPSVERLWAIAEICTRTRVKW